MSRADLCRQVCYHGQRRRSVERRSSGLGLGDNNITIVVSQDRVEDAASSSPAGEGGKTWNIQIEQLSVNISIPRS